MIKHSIIILTFVSFFLSCKKQNEQQLDPFIPTQDVIVASNVRIISLEENRELIFIDSSKLTFSAAGGIVSKVSAGDIMVAGITPQSPQGYLRKVLRVDHNNATTTFYTEQASLSETIINGDLSVAQLYQPENSRSRDFHMDVDLPIYDADFNFFTKDDQVRMKGTIDVSPKLILDAKWRGFMNLDYMKVGFEMENTRDLHIEGDLNVLPKDFIKEFDIYSKFLRPIQFMVGPVPVVITSYFKVKLGVKGNGEININTVYQGSSQVEAYVEKPSGMRTGNFSSWNRVLNVQGSNTLNITNLKSAAIQAINGYGIDIELPFLRAGIDFCLYDYCNARSSVYAKAALNVDYDVLTQGGSKTDIDFVMGACIDFKLKVWIKTLVYNEWCLIEKSWDVWDNVNVAPDNLVAQYQLDGDANDISGNEHHGVALGATPVMDRYGNNENAMYFNGNFSGVDIVNRSLITTKDITITMWIRPDFDYNDPGSNYLFDASPNSDRYLLYKNDQVGLVSYAGGSLTGTLAATNPTWWNKQQWMHVAIVYQADVNMTYLYVDGDLIQSFNSPFNQAQPTSLFIGKRFEAYQGTDHGSFVGAIDDVRVYDKALNAVLIGYLNDY